MDFRNYHFLVVLILLTLNVPVFAITYCIDDTDGLDSNTGISDNGDCTGTASQSWKTLNSIEVFSNSPGFQAGDKILLKRGGVFYTPNSIVIKNSGVASNYIEFSDYGSGALPEPEIQFSGQELRFASLWTQQPAPNETIWLYNYTGAVVDGLWRDGVHLDPAINTSLDGGDFYWEKDIGIYYRAIDSDPVDDNLFRGGTGYGFDITGLSYLKFSNLHLTTGPHAIGGGSNAVSSINNIIVENCEIENFTTGIFLISRYGQNNHDITTQNNTFTNNGRGVLFISNSNGVEKNIDIIVKGNTFNGIDPYEYYEDFKTSIGRAIDIEAVSFQNGNSTSVTDNIFNTGAREGAIVYWTNKNSTSHNNTVARNTIHDITGPGISMFGSNIPNTHTGNSIHYNVIYNCPDDGGIRLSAADDSDQNLIANNTIVNCGTSIFMNVLSAGFTIRNNISLNPTGKHIWHEGATLQSSLDTNIYYPDYDGGFVINADNKNLVEWQLYGNQDINSIDTDPVLQDLASNNFQLTSLSISAIDTGTPVNLTNDFDNNVIINSPDIGAYEYQPDTDGDGITDTLDNCPNNSNPNQTDSDSDTIGNVCDTETLPTLFSNASQDGWVRESGENTNVGGKNAAGGQGRQAIRIGDHGNKRQYKAIVSFNTASLPANAVITSATVELTDGGNTKGYPSSLGVIYTDLSTDGFNSNPSLENADFEALATVEHVATLVDGTGEVREANIGVMGLQAIEGTTLAQFRFAYSLDDNNDSVRDTLGHFASNHSNSSKHPRLIIEYTLPD